MKKLVILLFVGLLSFFALATASDDKWILIVTNEDDEQFFIMRDSLQLGSIQGINFVGSMGKVTSKGEDDVTVWFVALDDCGSKAGSLVGTTTEGKFLFRYPFDYKDVQTVTVVAKVMCTAANQLEKSKQTPLNPVKKPSPFQEVWHKDHRTGAIVV
jgi:hypothetical protein